MRSDIPQVHPSRTPLSPGVEQPEHIGVQGAEGLDRIGPADVTADGVGDTLSAIWQRNLARFVVDNRIANGDALLAAQASLGAEIGRALLGGDLLGELDAVRVRRIKRK